MFLIHIASNSKSNTLLVKIFYNQYSGSISFFLFFDKWIYDICCLKLIYCIIYELYHLLPFLPFLIIFFFQNCWGLFAKYSSFLFRCNSFSLSINAILHCRLVGSPILVVFLFWRYQADYYNILQNWFFTLRKELIIQYIFPIWPHRQKNFLRVKSRQLLFNCL